MRRSKAGRRAARSCWKDSDLVPQQASRKDGARDFDAVIVGAGFAGMYMLHRLRGLGFRARVFEAGSGVGG
ncbi:MAG TPA: NAD(P)-binding protein, partial [Xanthobacteraceae bacterium]|nr:NAD(P)-binding protein [Xanthobacteraceae bacterium]